MRGHRRRRDPGGHGPGDEAVTSLREAVERMTPASVEAWLEMLDGNVTMACRDCCNCLFAKFLTEQIGTWVGIALHMAHVNGESFVTAGGGMAYLPPEEVILPDWAQRTILRFDSGRVKSRDAKSSLRILRAVCPELCEVGQ
jgi:hypothetical protein